MQDTTIHSVNDHLAQREEGGGEELELGRSSMKKTTVPSRVPGNFAFSWHPWVDLG